MNTRNLGFVGERLREVRLARGLTGVALAELIGVSRAAVSQYERGETTPRPQLMLQIANALDVPATYFLKQIEHRTELVFWRSNAATTKSARIRAEIHLHWLSDLVHQLEETIRFPEANLPNLDLPSEPDQYNQETIEYAAETSRRHWSLSDGPISNVTWLLENNGIIVNVGELEEPNLDSFSRFGETDNFPLVFLNLDKASAVRSRFDAAHELGHLILHRHIDPDYWSDSDRIKIREEQAHSFAGAFLLPGKSFVYDAGMPSLNSLLEIKLKWKVSVQAMLMRCKALGILMEGQDAPLWRSLSRRRWKTIEPLDDVIEHEHPRLLPKAIKLLAEVNPLAPLDLVSQIGMSSTDVAQLAMVPASMFENPAESNVIHLYRSSE